MSMPEAAMDEDDRTVLPEHHVRLSRKPLHVKAVSEAARMERSAHRQFGTGVPAPDAGHHPAARRLINNVGQALLPL